MMRKCTCCNVELIEGLKVKMDNAPLSSFTLYVNRKAVKTEAALCPACGQIFLYACDPAGKTGKETAK